MEGHLAGIPKLLQVLRLGPPSFLLHSSPDMLNNIHIWRLCWPSLKGLDLLPPEKLHSGTWGMARSSILLKNLTPLVVGNVLGGNNLLIFGTINVTIHLTDLPGTSILEVPWRSWTILAVLRMALNWRLIWKIYFSPLFCCGPWHTQHGFLAVSCLALVSGQQYDHGDHCEQESDIQFLTKNRRRWCPNPPGAASLQLQSETWTWVLMISTGFWFDLGHFDRSNV